MTADNYEIQTNSEQETASFARDFAKNLKAGDVILLYGDLGMGKTVFSRAVIRALCGNDSQEVPSPTFTLVQTYEAPSADIYHFDLYRLSDPSEIYEIGWEEALSSDCVTIVEWPERLDYLTPEKATKVAFSYDKDFPDKRNIRIEKI